MPLLSLIGRLHRSGISGSGGLFKIAEAAAQEEPFEGALKLIMNTTH